VSLDTRQGERRHRPSMRDVARAAGVSQTTVSFVINGVESHIPRATQQRVWDAVERLGYRPNALARGLRSNRTDTIGFLSDEIATVSGAGRMIQGAQDAALERGKLLLLVSTGGDRELEARASAMMLDHRVDGIVYAAMHHCVVDPAEDVRSVPAVLLDAQSRDGSLPAVVPDEESGTLVAMAVLLDAGHRRIGLLSGVRAVPATEGRLVGCRRALADRDLPFDPGLVVGCDDAARDGYDGARSLLRGDDPPTALVCFSDRIAMGAYQALSELELRIPEDVAVVGFDDHGLIAPSLRPRLSTIALPHYAMGRWAVEHLLELIVSAGAPRLVRAAQRRLPCLYVARESV
jgi:LacI family transcriptional regulator